MFFQVNHMVTNKYSDHKLAVITKQEAAMHCRAALSRRTQKFNMHISASVTLLYRLGYYSAVT